MNVMGWVMFLQNLVATLRNYDEYIYIYIYIYI
jgi:hypothetical protein